MPNSLRRKKTNILTALLPLWRKRRKREKNVVPTGCSRGGAGSFFEFRVRRKGKGKAALFVGKEGKLVQSKLVCEGKEGRPNTVPSDGVMKERKSRKYLLWRGEGEKEA